MADREGDASSGFFTAAQALALVAYGEPDALDRPAPGEPDLAERWGYVDAPFAVLRRKPPLGELRWVWARVRWRLTRAWRTGRWRQCPLRPLSREGRAHVRALLRRYRKPPPELIAALRMDIERAQRAQAERAARLRAADRVLCAAAADGSLPVFGRRGQSAAETFTRLDHETVPPAFFLHRHRTLAEKVGWARIGGDAPMDEWAAWRRADAPDWGDLRFPQAEVLALAASGHAPAAVAPPVTIESLPAFWSLHETLAWIMLRDPRIVREAAPETLREAGTYLAETRAPGAEIAVAPCPGSPGWSPMKLDDEHRQRQQRGEPCGPAALEAREELLSRLRCGAPVAQADGKAVSAAMWRGARLTLTTAAMGPTVELSTGRTLDVLLARDDVVREWPVLRADVPAESGTHREGAPEAPSVALPSETQAPPTQRKHNISGRPRRDDFIVFAQEVTERLSFDGGNFTQSAFRREMKQWAAENMAPAPDDRTVERWIGQLVRSNVFVPD